MKWNKKLYKHGDCRLVTRYCIFPRCAEPKLSPGSREWRWLEKVQIQQQYDTYGPFKSWENIKFIDIETL